MNIAKLIILNIIIQVIWWGGIIYGYYWAKKVYGGRFR